MKRRRSGRGGKPGASASRHFSEAMRVAPGKKRFPPVWSRWWWVLMRVAIGLRVVFLIAATSLRVIDGTIRASTSTFPSWPRMSPALETPVSPAGSIPDAWTYAKTLGPTSSIPLFQRVGTSWHAMGRLRHRLLDEWQSEVDDERSRDEVDHPVNPPPLAVEDLDRDVGHEARADPVGDGPGERHRQHRHERGDRLLVVLPRDVPRDRHHEEADDDQRGCGRLGGDHAREGREEHGQEKEDAHDDRREAGPAPFRHTRGGLDVGRVAARVGEAAQAG